jgi:hypothetical protein
MKKYYGIFSKAKFGKISPGKYPVRVGAEFNHLIDVTIENLHKNCIPSEVLWNTDMNSSSYGIYDDSEVILCDMVIGRPTHDFIKYRRKLGLDYFYIDHGYFWRGYARHTGNNNPHSQEWYRISKNSHVLSKILDVDDSRWKKYFYDHFNGYGKEYKKRGSKIIFCRSSKHVLSIYGQENWAEETLETLKKNTDREIVIREKPDKSNQLSNKSQSTGVTLEQDLEDCWALVTHSSAAAIHAQLMGIPTFSDVNSPTSPVSQSDYSLIETPYYPDDEIRMKWLNSLAFSQYSREEFETGVVSNNLGLL